MVRYALVGKTRLRYFQALLQVREERRQLDGEETIQNTLIIHNLLLIFSFSRSC